MRLKLYIPLPKSILEYSLIVTLCSNVMFLNQIALLVTVLRNIHYGILFTGKLMSMKMPLLETATKKIMISYAVSGFMLIKKSNT